MKEFIRNTIDTLKDNRFSWKFKLLNILTNDELRWELACISITTRNNKDWIEQVHSEYSYAARRMDNILEHLDNIWNI